jgi:hypothetical protein
MSVDLAHSCMKRRLPVYLTIRANTTLHPKKAFPIRPVNSDTSHND